MDRNSRPGDTRPLRQQQERAPGRGIARPGVFLCECGALWSRAPYHDRRILQGDDFAGDAWRSEGRPIRYTVPGYRPSSPCWSCERVALTTLGHQLLAELEQQGRAP